MKKNKDRPKKFIIEIEDLEVLARLKGTVEWDVVKKLANNYIYNLKNVSFKLKEHDPNYLAARHAELTGQALGIRMLIQFIDKAGEKLEEK